MQNKHIYFGVGGLVAGLILAHLFTFMHYGGDYRRDYGMNTRHGMSDEMGSMTYGLSGKTGDDFDKAFIKEMITHHQGAVAMANMALVSAKHAEIKTLASAIIAAQTKEIGDMQAWYKNWYGEDISGSNPPNSAEGAPMGSIHNMPVPEGVSAARAALAFFLNIPESKILINEVIEKDWSDICLDIKERSEMSCSRVITPGYRVLMQAGGKEYVYRTNMSGSIVKAE